MILLPNNIYQGDSLELIQYINDNSIDMLLTDPPYGINFQSNYRDINKKIFDKIINDDNLDWFQYFTDQCFRIMKNNTAGYIFTSFKTYPIMFQSLVKSGFNVRNVLIAKRGTKGGLGSLLNSFAPDDEWIIYINKGSRNFNKTELCKTDGRDKKKVYRRRLSTVWFDTNYNTFPACSINPSTQRKRGDSIIHNTEKNTEFLKWLLLLSSNENDVVFDPFMGVGTTPISCIQLSRKYIGIEIQNTFFEIAKNKINSS